KSCPQATSGRRNPSTRITSCEIPAATPAISCGRTGGCRGAGFEARRDRRRRHHGRNHFAQELRMKAAVFQLPTRRGFPAGPAAALSAGLFVFASPNYAETMTMTTSDAVAAAPATRQAAEDRSIRPFTFHASQAALDNLRQRIAATQWPEKE